MRKQTDLKDTKSRFKILPIKQMLKNDELYKDVDDDQVNYNKLKKNLDVFKLVVNLAKNRTFFFN